MAKTRNRADLAEKMEIIGQVFEIDGMSDLLNKYDPGMNSIKFNAVTVQVSGLLLQRKRDLADKIVAMHTEKTDAQVQEMDDAQYALELRNAIITDVMGFFVSSPRSDGQK